jgi:hypothetical protein
MTWTQYIAIASCLLFVFPSAGILSQAVPAQARQVLSIPLETTGAPLVGRLRHAAFRHDGGVVIADDAELTLHVFDQAGRFVRSIGRAGGGPGEFKSLQWVGRCGDGVMMAFDGKQSRLSYFAASDGRYARQRSSPVLESVNGCLADGTVVGIARGQSSSSAMRGDVIALLANDSVLRVRRDVLVQEALPLGSALHVDVGWTAVVFGSSDSAFLSLHSTLGATPTRVQAGVANRLPSDEQRAEAVRVLARTFHGTTEDYARNERVYSRLPRAKVLPAFSAIFVDERRDRLWVVRSHPGDTRLLMECRSLSPTTGNVTLVSVPAKLRPLDVLDGRLLAFAEDPSSGLGDVRVYALGGC